MASPVSFYLSKVSEEVIWKLFKTICATRYKDPINQDSFLLGSAKLVVNFFTWSFSCSNSTCLSSYPSEHRSSHSWLLPSLLNVSSSSGPWCTPIMLISEHRLAMHLFLFKILLVKLCASDKSSVTVSLLRLTMFMPLKVLLHVWNAVLFLKHCSCQ